MPMITSLFPICTPVNMAEEGDVLLSVKGTFRQGLKEIVNGSLLP